MDGASVSILSGECMVWDEELIGLDGEERMAVMARKGAPIIDGEFDDRYWYILTRMHEAMHYRWKRKRASERNAPVYAPAG